MEYNLDVTRLSSVHLPDCSVVIFDPEVTNSERVVISSSFDNEENGEEIAKIRSTASYKEITTRNTVSISTEHLSSILIDCVKAETPMDIFNHPEFNPIQESIITSFISALQVNNEGCLILESNTNKPFINGLGIIYEKDKAIGLFESMRVHNSGSDDFAEIDHVLLDGNKEIPYSADVRFEYYDLHDNMMLSFKGISSRERIERFKITSYSTIDDTNPIVELIKEAYKVPYVNNDKADFVNEQKYGEYRNSRLSVISETREKDRKKAITSKFSDIDLF